MDDLLFPKTLSSPRPAKTRSTPPHCLGRSGLENRMTDPRMVKNFLVVVIMEQVSGPKVVTVTKIKCCREEAKEIS